MIWTFLLFNCLITHTRTISTGLAAIQVHRLPNPQGFFPRAQNHKRLMSQSFGMMRSQWVVERNEFFLKWNKQKHSFVDWRSIFRAKNTEIAFIAFGMKRFLRFLWLSLKHRDPVIGEALRQRTKRSKKSLFLLTWKHNFDQIEMRISLIFCQSFGGPMQIEGCGLALHLKNLSFYSQARAILH